MSFIFESHKVFNELRNDTDFLTATGDFTTTVKALVGERIKIVSKFRASWELIANPTLNADILTVTTVSGGLRITSSSLDFEAKKFRVGDIFDFIIIGGTTHVGETITFVQGNIIEVSDTATPTIPTIAYDDVEIRGTTDLNTLAFKYNFPASSNPDNLISALFGLIPTFDFSDLVISGGDITGVPRSPLYWVSGGMVARRLATVNTYEQVYEVELTVVLPYFLQGEFNNLVTKVRPFPFSVETQFYTEDLELSKDNNAETIRPFKIDRPVNDSIDWFNSNLNGGAEPYSVVSIDYEDDASGDELDMPEVTIVTKVTTVIASSGTTFSATDPIIISFSYLPTQIASKSPTGDFDDNWIYESVRTEIDAAPVNGTIIKALEVVLDDPNQITVTHTLEFTQTQQDLTFNAGQFVTWATMEDPSLDPEVTNRENLIIDANTVTKNSDISGLLTVIRDDVYYHPDVFDEGVTEGFTDLEEWNEAGIMRDIEFDLQTESDQLIQITQMFAQIIAYNSSTGKSFVIQSISVPTLLLEKVLSTSNTLIHEIFVDTTRGLLLTDGSKFNFLKLRNTTFSNPLQRYRMQIGMVLNWEFYRSLNGADQSFFDVSEPRNGLNLDTAHYSGVNGFDIRLALIFDIKANNGIEDVITRYRSISEAGSVFDFGTNSVFTKTFVYKDKNNDVLEKVGDKGFGPDNADTKVIVTWDDTTNKMSPSEFEAIVTLELKEQATERNIHRISSIEGVIESDILKPLAGETLLKKSIVGGKFTVECLIDGARGSLAEYQISAELYVLAVTNQFSMRYDGVNEYIKYGNYAAINFDFDDAFSWGGWFYQANTNNMRHVNKVGTPGVGNRGYVLSSQSGSNKYQVQIRNGSTLGITKDFTGVTITSGVWRHVMVTKSTSSLASGVKLYVDGTEIVSVSVIDDSLASNTIQHTSDLNLGTFNGSTSGALFDGDMDEISIWSKELSSAEVTEVMNSTNLKAHSANANLEFLHLGGDTATFNSPNWDFISEVAGQTTGQSVNMQLGSRVTNVH